MKKSHAFGGGIVAFIAVWAIWAMWLSPTKIAFVNYQTVSLGQMGKANNNPMIRINELSVDNIDDITSFDMVFINGMGLRITEAQRAVVQAAADAGVPILTSSATNPTNNISSLDSIQKDNISKYLYNGGRQNLRNMYSYIRSSIDGKKIYTPTPGEPIERKRDLFYHPNMEDREDDNVGYNSVGAFDNYLKKHNLYKEKAPRILVTGMMGEPTDLILELEKQGNVVYPVNSVYTIMRNGMIDSIRPAAVINMAHGRMGDAVVSYLTRQNIPLFIPLSTGRLVEAWEADKMGMSGGFLSQSVVTPEIDGAIRPFALFGNFVGDDGLQYVKAIPERLETFTATINNYVKLQKKPNAEKRVVIYYFKGAGQSALTAGGMEVAPSLFNMLTELKDAGYNVNGLPATSKELEKLIQKQGAVFGSYAEGAQANFMESGSPLLVGKEEYESWVKKSIRPENYADVVALNGEFPGEYMSTSDGRLGIARIEFGNVVIMPQTAAGGGKESFKILHGTDAAPPHPYIAQYLWAQHGFKADAMIHFGTHGSLEFTPKKQVALSSNDWSDRLVGALPHFYVYTISNIGEGVIAKRRAYAGLQSHLTPPFLESSLRGIYRELMEKIKIYNGLFEPDQFGRAPKIDPEKVRRASLAVKEKTVAMGIHTDLNLDSVLTNPYSETEILKIENFAEELATEKITGQLYTIGVPYEPKRIESTVHAMCIEPIAYSLYALDKMDGKATQKTQKHKPTFTRLYLNPAKALVADILANPKLANDEAICRMAKITPQDLEKARAINKFRNAPKGMMAMMAMGGRPKKAAKAPNYSKADITRAMAILEIERTIKNVNNYREALKASPSVEIKSMINALNGGYTKPSPAGDPIANPNTLPTGRNMYAVDAEMTPSESAWEKGIRLANSTLSLYRERHNDSLPRKVSYTLWSGEFIETGGATIAQVLYMLGVEPIRDSRGRVSDLRLIPSKELGRPRIDVVVQTSGQLRDIAASRLFLINRAVEMAAAAKDDEFTNEVAQGVVEAERTLIEKGLNPKDAREIAAYRVFGGANGGYGTSTQGMVLKSDQWNNTDQIADAYLNNMGAYYGSEKNWEAFRQYAFEAALTRTDAVIHPRQSNTWGALSLDHVYEFMGGMNNAVRKVTGKDPDAYFSDYRNRNNVKIQELEEAIGVESRTTILNPTYIKEKMKGEATSAGIFAATIENTFAWNVLKPSVIEDRLWDDIHDVYIKDKFDLGVHEFFEEQNPAALQAVTATMLEAVRKGLWEANEQQIKEMADLHTELVNKYQAACTGFVCDNAKLREFISEKTSPEAAQKYNAAIKKAREVAVEADKKGVVMKKEEMTSKQAESKSSINNLAVIAIVAAAIAAIILVIRRRRKMQE